MNETEWYGEESDRLEKQIEEESEMKKCCLNCHYFFSDDENSCLGRSDTENDSCHEYKESLYKNNSKEGEKE